jgi:hypothetical protein
MKPTAAWNYAYWHSAECAEKSGNVGDYPVQGIDRTLTWVRASAKDGCEACRIIQSAIETFCETWDPTHCKNLRKQRTSLFDYDYDVSLGVYGEIGLLRISFSEGVTGWLNGSLEIFTVPGIAPIQLLATIVW